MSVLQALDIGLALLVFAVAAWTIFARGAFAATVGYVVYGLLLSLVWIRLFAVDVALTEAAIGSGVTGVLLIGAAARLRAAETASDRDIPERPLAHVCCCSLRPCRSGACRRRAAAARPRPVPGAAIDAEPARNRPRQSGHGRSDCLPRVRHHAGKGRAGSGRGRRVVARRRQILGRRSGRGARGANPEPTLAFLAQILAPLGILVGIHVFWVGADEPGGAFQGGAILAAMWIIVMMARLTEAPQTNAFWLRLALVAGPLVFLAAGVAGAIFAGGFFAYPPGFAKPAILFIEAFMVLSIAVTLPMLVAGPPRREPRQ